MNTYNTQYQVVTDMAKVVGYRCRFTDPNLYMNPYAQMDS